GDHPRRGRRLPADGAVREPAAGRRPGRGRERVHRLRADGDGDRLAEVTTGLLFAVALLIIPLVQPLQHLGYAYGPAPIAVGVLMMGAVRKIDFDDPTEGVPAFLTLAMIVFTYNIANGLTAGLIVYPVLKVLAGRARERRAGAGVLALAPPGHYRLGLPPRARIPARRRHPTQAHTATHPPPPRAPPLPH